MLQAQAGALRSQTREAAPAEMCDVEDSDPRSFFFHSQTSEAAPVELCDVEDSDPRSPLSGR